VQPADGFPSCRRSLVADYYIVAAFFSLLLRDEIGENEIRAPRPPLLARLPQQQYELRPNEN